MNGRMAVVLVVLLLAGAAAWFVIGNKHDATEHVSASKTRITLEEDTQQNLTEIDRETSPTVYFQVTLKAPPLGEKLSLACEWIDPHGQVAHRNRYETKLIDHENWNTHCRDTFDPGSPTGTWTVAMSLDRRQLARTSFVLRSGKRSEAK